MMTDNIKNMLLTEIIDHLFIIMCIITNFVFLKL